MSEQLQRMRRVGADIAAKHAGSVDAEARFPHEAFAALKAEKLLGVMVPTELGGAGASISEVVALCHALGQYCGSTAMIFAMHQIQVACLVRHGLQSEWHRAFMRRLTSEQLLLGSATSEAGIGGDVRSSICAMEVQGARFKLSKNATVISYGADSDAIMVTARRTAESPASDQVIVPILKSDYRLEQTSTWDTLGMRGTCSIGYWLHGAGDVAQIMPLPYADISAQTMLPTSHLTWSSLWLGIATDAVARARAFVRAEARRKAGTVPPGALRLAEAVNLLQLMKSNVVAAARQYEAALASPELLTALSFAVAMNNLKTGTSQMAVQVVNHALLICGISGYRNDSDYSVCRHLRDAHSAALMVSNDRILANTANLLLVLKDDPGLFP
ncbi:MAG: acyl-CoA/acyl-ACP dehydrogenase [Alphaproteobacteria bacterium]|nr:acyl-CoA/acyl-ACP dehydrogenase [Alphaproteobacteria bacterium]